MGWGRVLGAVVLGGLWGVEVGRMGAGAVGCGPCMNAVPRLRELKSGGDGGWGGWADGNQSTSPLGSHSRAAGFLSWCSRELIEKFSPLKLPSELAFRSSIRPSSGCVCLQIQVCLARCYQIFSTTMTFQVAVATGQMEETILKAGALEPSLGF